uniref:Uncharacterized protein n=1 Tax=Candidatus Kentrum sp. LPFa TaxID=2126335 RepID=A0A450X7E0_9GAMM|nr:MAG: hypothetical protein BECKLPF1236A_GA0070988_1001810 [Candidatus Kentron sp. LPFa]VFK25173.1 MAG: hypothetical protein BECKLPF1236C_GA0070990_1001922 [Candidatus Kentron sp. LPFa]
MSAVSRRYLRADPDALFPHIRILRATLFVYIPQFPRDFYSGR